MDDGMDNGNGASDTDNGSGSAGATDVGSFGGSVSAVEGGSQNSQNGPSNDSPAAGSLDMSGNGPNDGTNASVDSATIGSNPSMTFTGTDAAVLAGTAATIAGILAPGANLARMAIVGGSTTVGIASGALGAAIGHAAADVSTANSLGISAAIGNHSMDAPAVGIHITASEPVGVIAAGPVAVDNYHALLNLGLIPN
jgi:hypothetical protein